MFAPIWIGCNCGETWHVAYHTECDTHNDRVYEIPYCTICMKEVAKPKTDPDGRAYLHALTESEIESEMMGWGEDEDCGDNDTWTCRTCGGQFWDGGTSCTCQDWDDDSDTNGKKEQPQIEWNGEDDLPF